MNLATSLLLSSASDSFVKLFTEMQPIVIVLFIVGVVLCCIEIFTPGFGWFGLTGIAAIVASLVIRMLNGGDMWMFLYMMIIYIALFTVMFIVMKRSIKHGRLSRSGIFNVGTSVPEGKTEATRDYDYLVGKVGVAMTILRPIGQVDFDGEVVDVLCNASYIDIGEKVVVVATEGSIVRVKRV